MDSVFCSIETLGMMCLEDHRNVGFVQVDYIKSDRIRFFYEMPS